MPVRSLLVVICFVLAIPVAAHAADAPQAVGPPSPSALVRVRTKARSLVTSARIPKLKAAVQARVQAKQEGPDTLADRIADKVSRHTGSFRYYAVLATSLASWMAWNTWSGHPIDPPPFVGANTFISVLTLTSQFFLQMSTNRQGALDRRREEQDHKVNLKAEREVRALDTDMNGRFDKMALQIEELTALVQSLKATKNVDTKAKAD